jgi:phage-related tail fiber protein
MSKIALSGDPSGTGTFTIASPNSNSNFTLTLPTESGTIGVNSSPAGTVIFYAANTAPTGFLKANGANVSRTTYATLFTAIGTTFGVGDGSTTFGLPDLRGEFIRGWDDGRGIDSGRVFGSAQTDAMQGHYHEFTGYAGGGGDNFRTMVGFSLAATLRTGDGSAGVRQPITDGTNGTPRTATETRPRNIALLACIKF